MFTLINLTGTMANPTNNTNNGRRLFIPHLAPYTRKQDVLKKFMEMGAIAAIVVLRSYGNSAFLHFATPEAATKAMEASGKIVLHKRKIELLRLDPWHDAKVSRGKRTQSNEEHYEPNPINLPVECLAKIAEYLPYADRARMEQVSWLWREDSIASHAKQTVLTSTTWVWTDEKNRDAGMSPEGFRWAMQKCGRYLRVLNLSQSTRLTSQAISIAAKMCTQLTHLDITAVPIREAALREISTLTTLHNLKLGLCKGPIDPDLALVLANNLNLRILEIRSNDLTGRCLLSGRSLSELQCSECHNIRDTLLAEVIESRKELQRLRLIDCTGVRSAVIVESITKNTKLTHTLEKLNISGLGPRDLITDDETSKRAGKAIRSITQLQLNACGWVNNRAISDIARHVGGLRKLNISSNINIIGEFALECLGNLSQMEELKINDLHPSVGGFFLSALTNLRQLHCQYNGGIKDEDICGLLQNNRHLECARLQGCTRITRVTVETTRRTIPFRLVNKLHLHLWATQARPSRFDKKNNYLTMYYN